MNTFSETRLIQRDPGDERNCRVTEARLNSSKNDNPMREPFTNSLAHLGQIHEKKIISKLLHIFGNWTLD
jgi:hypothetical protein